MLIGNYDSTQIKPKTIFILGGVFLLLAVLLGAFGAHGLRDILMEKNMQTYQTGVTYQFYHAFALIVLGIMGQLFSRINFNLAAGFMLVGIILFSGNCIIYAMTSIKTFAMLVPLGGISFIIGWVLFIFKCTQI